MGEKNREKLKGDFKDQLKYRDFNKDIREYSNLQKWMIYNSYEYLDADVVIKENKELLGWAEYNYFDCIFSFKTYFGLLCKLFSQKEKSESEIRNMQPDKNYGIYNILKKEDVIEVIKKRSPNDCEEWAARLEKAINEFTYNTHTVGNYMPCPDGEYGIKKGLPMTVYNDRLELLYASEKTKPEWKKWIDKELELDSFKIRPIIESEKLKRLKLQNNRRLNPNSILDFIVWMEEANRIIKCRTEELLSLP